MNVGQSAHLSGQMSGQAAQMNQVGGSGADGMPQHQQMQDVVGLGGEIDPQFVMLRNNMRKKIFEYIGRKQSSADWRPRLPELARRLEEILFRKFPNKNEYFNMMEAPVEPQLQFAIKTLSAQNQQNQQNQQMSRQIASSSGCGTMSGQVVQMNQVGGSGVGGSGADGMPQHQQMQDVVGLGGEIDPQFVMLRNNMRKKIFEYIGRKQSSADWRPRLPELARRLEEILFRKFPNKNEYFNMMEAPVEPQLQVAIKTLSAQSQQNQQNQQNQQMSRQIASSSGYGTMIPTPGITQGTSGNSRMSYVTDNTGLSSSGASMVPQNANMGTSLPGSMSNGYQHLTTSVPLNSTTNSVPSTMGTVGIQRQVTHMIPTPGFNNQQNVPANPDYSNGTGYFNGESAMTPHMQQQKQFPNNQNSHQIQHIGGHSNSVIHSSMLENSSAFGLSDGHINGGMGLHGSHTQISRMSYVTDNTGLSSSGASMVPQNANMGTSLPDHVPSQVPASPLDYLLDSPDSHGFSPYDEVDELIPPGQSSTTQQTRSPLSTQDIQDHEEEDPTLRMGRALLERERDSLGRGTYRR